ncbi:hypothetical protein KSS87_011560 [Heliosperma pusillum]|nr:hypothetical protein KSS87_011560 [Heliosperma pusillum]
MQKAMQCMEKALQLGPQHKRWAPKRAVISNILRWLGDNGDIDQVYEFLKLMSRVVQVNKSVYLTLKASKLGKDINVILQRLKDDNIAIDEETSELMRVLEWTNCKPVEDIASSDLPLHLDLVGKVHGIAAAEKFFEEANDDSAKMYNSLLNVYVQGGYEDKSLAVFEKMKEMGIALNPHTYNKVMSLYLKNRLADKVLDLLSEMQERGVSPNDVSYKMCLKACALNSDFDSMDKLVKAITDQHHLSFDWSTYTTVANYYIDGGHPEKGISCLKIAENTVHDHPVGYNFLVTSYTKLGDFTKVTELWQKQKDCKSHSNDDYMVMLGSLMKLYMFEQAEELLEEWRSSGNAYNHQVVGTVLSGYAQKGLAEKAEKLLEDQISINQTPDPMSWGIISEGYVECQNMQKALQCMEKALQLGPQHKGWVPKRTVISKILSWLGDNEDSDQVYELLKLMSRVVPVNKKSYLTLKASKLGKDINVIFERLKDDNIDIDEETIWERNPNFITAICEVYYGVVWLHVGFFSPLVLFFVIPLLEHYFAEDNSVFESDVPKIIRDLRKRKLFDRALEVLEWTNRKPVRHTNSSDLPLHLDLVGKVHGIAAAEKFFEEANDQSEKMYNSLLNFYVQGILVDKSLSLFEKMKEMGIASSPRTYNKIMSLYLKNRLADKPLDLLSEMQDKGVSPDEVSYKICLKACAFASDFDSMDKLVKALKDQHQLSFDWFTYATIANYYLDGGHPKKAISCLQIAEDMVHNNPVGYNFLISSYAKLGDFTKVTELWQKQKDVCKSHSNHDYMVMLSSLTKLDMFEQAEGLLEEWKASGNEFTHGVVDALLSGYVHKGLVEKAEKLLEDQISKNMTPVPISWGIISEGYINCQNMQKAVQCMEKALQLGPQHEGWAPKHAVMSNILTWLSQHGDSDQVHEFLKLMSRVAPMKDSCKHGKVVNAILQRLKDDNIDVDEETSKLMSVET